MSTQGKTVTVTLFGLLSAFSKMLLIPSILLISCNVADYITALIAVKMQGQKWDSNTGIKGICKKVLMWFLVFVGVAFDGLLEYASETIGLGLPVKFLVGCIVCIWLVCNEMISILENIKACGIKLPPFLEPLIKSAKEQVEDKAKPKEKTDGQ